MFKNRVPMKKKRYGQPFLPMEYEPAFRRLGHMNNEELVILSLERNDDLPL